MSHCRRPKATNPSAKRVEYSSSWHGEWLQYLFDISPSRWADVNWPNSNRTGPTFSTKSDIAPNVTLVPTAGKLPLKFFMKTAPSR